MPPLGMTSPLLNAVIVPAGVIRTTPPGEAVLTNHMLPSGPAVIPDGYVPASSENSVTVPVGVTRPTAGARAEPAVNQRLPSAALAMRAGLLRRRDAELGDRDRGGARGRPQRRDRRDRRARSRAGADGLCVHRSLRPYRPAARRRLRGGRIYENRPRSAIARDERPGGGVGSPACHALPAHPARRGSRRGRPALGLPAARARRRRRRPALPRRRARAPAARRRAPGDRARRADRCRAACCSAPGRRAATTPSGRSRGCASRSPSTTTCASSTSASATTR